MSKNRVSEILQRAARTTLAPLGVEQVGRSRNWQDDRRWYMTTVEFQPSDFSKGTYLNVGVCWLWAENDYVSFDVGHRIDGYVEYESDQQFEPEAHRLAVLAAKKVQHYRARFTTAARAARHYGVLFGRNLGIWERFHAGVLRGLLGHSWRSGWHLGRCSAEARGSDLDWEIARARRAADLRALARDTGAFRRELRATIARSRTLLGLGGLDGDPLPEDVRD
jgi:hypothetical protein